MDFIYELMGKDVGAVFILVFARFVFIFSFMFIISSPAINFKIKALISFFLALIFIDKANVDLSSITTATYVELIANELLIAFTISLAVNIVLYSYKIFGELLSYSAGLSMAQIFDAATGAQEQILNKLFYVAVAYLFFSMDIYQLFLLSLNNMYIVFPVGYDMLNNFKAIEFMSSKFSIVLMNMFVLTLPFFLLTTIIDIYFGYSTRNSPAFNIFAIAFQVKFILLVTFLYLISTYIIEDIHDLIINIGTI